MAISPESLTTQLQTMNAQHAGVLSVSGSAEQRLSLLAGADVAVGTKVHDSVTGQVVEVVSAGEVYVSSEVVNDL